MFRDLVHLGDCNYTGDLYLYFPLVLFSSLNHPDKLVAYIHPKRDILYPIIKHPIVNGS